MPYSLRVKVKKLRYKGMLTDKECDRLCKALEREHCEDCISRHEVLSIIECRKNIDGNDAIVWIEKEIGELPSVTPHARWIPCSERLPDKDGCYLVSTTGTNNDIIDIAYYTEEIWHKASRIKAWMPLPEPYRGGDTDAE